MSMSSSNCCFLTCIQIFQETGKVVWYSHLFQNFPEFVLIHTVKGFGVVNKAEVVVFLKLSCCLDNPTGVGNLISGSSAFSKSSLNMWKLTVHVLLKPKMGTIKDRNGMDLTEAENVKKRWQEELYKNYLHDPDFDTTFKIRRCCFRDNDKEPLFRVN